MDGKQKWRKVDFLDSCCIREPCMYIHNYLYCNCIVWYNTNPHSKTKMREILQKLLSCAESVERIIPESMSPGGV